MNILNRRKGVLSDAPKTITIGVGSACNNKCLFCSYHGEDARDISKVYNLPFMLSLDDFKKIVDMAWGGKYHMYIYVQQGNHF